jgi:predicted enzyme related to lactoylglutathione lyase
MKNNDNTDLCDQNTLSAVIIKVQNLNICRSFYRELLDLGAPVMDSNFWVEFKLGECASLILEQIITGEPTPEGRGRIAWLCAVKDYEQTVERLKANGYDPLGEEEEHLGMKILNFLDPEGNPFTICDESKRHKRHSK